MVFTIVSNCPENQQLWLSNIKMRTLPEAMQVGINADLDRVLCHILQLQYITFGLYREENHLKKNRGRDVPFQRSRKMTSLP